MYYVFGKSAIWEAGDPLDAMEGLTIVKVKTVSKIDVMERKARQARPKIEMGRMWIKIARSENDPREHMKNCDKCNGLGVLRIDGICECVTENADEVFRTQIR